ncbi:hypothetical protein BTR14_20575 [Rhizobium rhizosphaerae]|uniref:DUF222 domain-containing protein n=1 Tax=Xaviernesmea rhizosphaerae TaxID=1672749 RepID=A0ABX3P840_9HYPH|nr:hypothetical protein [Xaviernesmea rhizosphaerae]OQP84200.1 hypothetical protein BTR14_20575 [Xaviernesmea rhizosphaerae]
MNQLKPIPARSAVSSILADIDHMSDVAALDLAASLLPNALAVRIAAIGKKIAQDQAEQVSPFAHRNELIREHSRSCLPPGMSLRKRAQEIERDFARASCTDAPTSPRILSARMIWLFCEGKTPRARRIIDILRED